MLLIFKNDVKFNRGGSCMIILLTSLMNKHGKSIVIAGIKSDSTDVKSNLLMRLLCFTWLLCLSNASALKVNRRSRRYLCFLFSRIRYLDTSDWITLHSLISTLESLYFTKKTFHNREFCSYWLTEYPINEIAYIP